MLADAIITVWLTGFALAFAITFMYFSCVAAGILFACNVLNMIASFFWPSKRRAVVFIILSLLPLVIGLVGSGIATVCSNIASCGIAGTADSADLKDIASPMSVLVWISAGVGIILSIVNVIFASLGSLISNILTRKKTAI